MASQPNPIPANDPPARPERPPASRTLGLHEPAPAFRARSTQGDVALADYRGRWLLLFAHPADFTPVCTTELIALARAADRFAALDCALLGLSVDSLFAHVAWLRSIEADFGVAIPFPLLEDPSMAIARAFGMIHPNAADAATVRAVVVIDPAGLIRATTCYPVEVGRNVEELLRLVAALQTADRGGVATPEAWRPGEPVLAAPGLERAGGEGTPWYCRAIPMPAAAAERPA